MHRVKSPYEPPSSGPTTAAVLLGRGKETAPPALRSVLEHTRVRHAQIVILSVETQPVPRVPADAAEHFRLPRDRTVVGSRVEVEHRSGGFQGQCRRRVFLFAAGGLGGIW